MGIAGIIPVAGASRQRREKSCEKVRMPKSAGDMTGLRGLHFAADASKFKQMVVVLFSPSEA